jgi:UDP-3-O-[3-hydroxymyristoyl] glucosamine N-acyltransferase
LIILSSNQSSKKLVAVSFDTATYHDLQCFVNEHDGYTLTRMDPEECLTTKRSVDVSYINLVVKDFKLRKQITQYLDDNDFDRFSLIHNQCYATSANIALGCVIYPMVTIYPSAVLQRDVIVHTFTVISHQSKIDVGGVINGMTCIAGSTSIGEFTQIGLGAIIYDNISIVANTIIGAGTMVRKNILTSGTYVGQTKNKLVKIK